MGELLPSRAPPLPIRLRLAVAYASRRSKRPPDPRLPRGRDGLPHPATPLAVLHLPLQHTVQIARSWFDIYQSKTGPAGSCVASCDNRLQAIDLLHTAQIRLPPFLPRWPNHRSQAISLLPPLGLGWRSRSAPEKLTARRSVSMRSRRE